MLKNLLLLALFGPLLVWGQPTVLYTSLSNTTPSPNNSRHTLNAMSGVFKQVRFQANQNITGGNAYWAFHLGSPSSPNYSSVWRPYTGNNTLSSNTYTPTTFDNGAKYNSNGGGSDGKLPAITSGNYYTFNVTSNTGNNVMQLLETSYNPVTLTAVNATNGTSGSKVITITTSATPHSEEYIYLRYTTNSYSSSTLVQATGSGTTWTATIPWQTSTVSYYVYSSNKTLTQINEDVTTYNSQTPHDMSTLNLNNNSGTNYAYTPIKGAISGTTIICSGSSTPLQVLITSGTSPYTLVYSDGTADFTINNYVSATNFNVFPLTSTSYSIVSITDASGSVGSGTTETAVISVTNVSTPTISAATSTTLCPGETVQLTASGSGHQWYKDDNLITGATASSYSANAPGAYTVISTVNGCSSAASAPTAVVVNALTVITEQPTTATQNGFSSPSLLVNASGNNLQFQWQVSTSGGTSWSDIAAPAGIANSYSPAPALSSLYRCVVTGSCGTETSNVSGLVTGVPTTTLSTSSCGTTLSSLGWGISASNVPNAASYMFEITAPNTLVYEVTSPDRWITLSEATGMSLLYGSNYSIKVRVQSAAGTWGNYGTSCTVTTPSIPAISLSAASCNTALPSIGWGISATNVASATAYMFEITAPNNATPYEVSSADRWITLSEATGMSLLYASNYSIRVKVQNGGTWSNYTSTCTVTTPAIPITTLSSASCNTILPSIGWGISATNVAAASAYRFNITVPGNTTPYVVESVDRWITLSEATGMPLLYATSYSITVEVKSGVNWSTAGTACTVTTPSLPTTTLSATSCDALLPSIGWGISATNVAAATKYRFNITAPGNTTPFVVESIDRWITLSEAAGMPLLYGTTYSMTVQVESGAGNWSAIGESCEVLTPAIPAIDLSTTSCGATLPSLGWGISATNVAAATQYEFKIINQTVGQTQTEYYVISPDRWITLSEGMAINNVPLVPQNNQAYVIRVRAYSGTQFGEYTESGCFLYTPTSQGMIVQDEDPQAYEDAAEGIVNQEEESLISQVKNTWTATATANPFEHSFKVNLNGAEAIENAAMFTATLTDMSGKVYTTQTLSKEALTEEHFGPDLASGMYLITLRQGEELRVLRVVKR